jgi:hypothetical protein
MEDETKTNGHWLQSEAGKQLATEGIDVLYDRVGRICQAEKLRIEAANQPRIASAKAELVQRQQEGPRLQEEIAKLPPEGDLRSRRRKAIGQWVIASVLVLAGFGFALVALEPFPLGWKRFLYGTGLAIIVPYSIDMVLQHYAHHQRVIRGTAIMAALFSIVAMSSLSLIRTELFTAQLSTAQSTSVVIDGDTPAAASEPEQGSFYKRTECLLILFMVLASLGMEIVAGCAFYNGQRLWVPMPPNVSELRERLAAINHRILELTQEIERLEKEPEHFVNEYWREFHRSLVKGTEKSMVTKIFCAALFFALFAFAPRSYAAEPLNLVVAVDLTASVAAAPSLNNQTELDKNLGEVSRLLAKAPAGSHVTVIGITDRSFTEPYVLLSAQLDGNEGYFHERIASARHQLVLAWNKRCASLISRFQRTDLLGALVVSGQLFKSREGWRNVLVLLSDMRQETKTLNLARSATVPSRAALEVAQRNALLADLKDVDVYVLGVDGAGKTVAYWDSLHQFWIEYFQACHARLRTYSMLRDTPDELER